LQEEDPAKWPEASLTKWQDQFDDRNRRLPQNTRSIGTKSVQMFQQELYISLIVYNSLAQFCRLPSSESPSKERVTT
jgi:hypothetical protein